MRWLLVALALAGIGCPPGKTVDSTPPNRVDTDQDKGKTTSDLKRDLEATVLENYQQINLGNMETYGDTLARRGIVLFGVGPGDVVVGQPPSSVDEFFRYPYADRGARVLSKNLEVHISADNSVGWIYDEVSLRVPYLRRQASIPIRLTAVFVRNIDRWEMVMEHSSYALPADDLLDAARRNVLETPMSIDTRFRKRGPGTRLRDILLRLHNGDIDRRRKLASEDTLLLLPDPDLELRGKADKDQVFLAELFDKYSDAEVTFDDYRIRVARTGTVAWIAATVRVKTTINDEPISLSLRGTYLLENRKLNGWEVVQAHVSAPIEEDRLSERIFGEKLPATSTGLAPR
jgi:ketosteroid isomerase-like protein